MFLIPVQKPDSSKFKNFDNFLFLHNIGNIPVTRNRRKALPWVKTLIPNYIEFIILEKNLRSTIFEVYYYYCIGF